MKYLIVVLLMFALAGCEKEDRFAQKPLSEIKEWVEYFTADDITTFCEYSADRKDYDRIVGWEWTYKHKQSLKDIGSKLTMKESLSY